MVTTLFHEDRRDRQMEEYEGWSPKVRAFDKKHGASVVTGEGGAWLLFEDGAMREQSGFGVTMKEPPKDRYELARLKVRYCELRLRDAVGKFESMKDKLLQIAAVDRNARFVNPLPGFTIEEAEKTLLALQAEARNCKADLDKAKAACVETTPKEVSGVERVSARNRKDKEALRDMVNRIQV
jgi:hypothetical protein